MQILIKGGRVVDPGNFDGIADISIEDGKIVEIQSNDNSRQPPTNNEKRATSNQQRATRIQNN